MVSSRYHPYPRRDIGARGHWLGTWTGAVFSISHVDLMGKRIYFFYIYRLPAFIVTEMPSVLLKQY